MVQEVLKTVQSLDVRFGVISEEQRLRGGNNEEGNLNGSLDRRLKDLVELLEKEDKTLETLIKNSTKDSMLLSECNSSLQKIKSAISSNKREVISIVQGVSDSVKGLEERSGVISEDQRLLGGTLNELKVNIEKSNLNDSLDLRLKEMVELLEKEDKTLEILMKNDALLISECNSSQQKMKAAMTSNKREVISIVQGVEETMQSLKERLGVIDEEQRKLGGSLNELKGNIGECKLQGSIDVRLREMVELLEKEDKTLEILMKNSTNESSLLSECNVSLQKMKAEMSSNGKEVISIVEGVSENMESLEERLGEICEYHRLLGGSVDEIRGNIDRLEREGLTCSSLGRMEEVRTELGKLTILIGPEGFRNYT